MPSLPKPTGLLCSLLLLRPSTSEWTGPLGLYFESTVPIETKQMHCPAGFVTGVTASYGRSKKGDRDTYDFQLKCGDRWGLWFGLQTFGVKVRTEKQFECPSGLSMTGLEVKRGRVENGDQDFYDFKLQCGGVWDEWMGMVFKKEKESKAAECPRGEMAFGVKVSRGFRDNGDMDIYEFELNCKRIDQQAQTLRPLPSLKKLGLKKNVLLWSVKDVCKWLKALGLKQYVPKFEENRVHGDVIFQMSELHLIEMGMTIMGDRLYLMESLQQLLETVAIWDEETQQFVIPVDGPAGAGGEQKALADLLAKQKKIGEVPQFLGGGSGAASPFKDSDVVQLTDDNFNAWMGKNVPWVVEFYAPWCSHCKQLAGQWKALASALKGYVKVGAIDATVERRLAQQYEVKYYPTIKVFINGQVEEYLGAHTAEAIGKFAINKLKQVSNQVGQLPGTNAQSAHYSYSGQQTY